MAVIEITRCFPKRQRHIKMDCFFLFVILLLTGCTQMQEKFEDVNNKLADMSFFQRSETVTAYALNLRKGPSTQSEIITQLKRGERVTIGGQEGRWVNVTTTSGRTGWVYGSYLTGFDTPFVKDTQTAKKASFPTVETQSKTEKQSTAKTCTDSPASSPPPQPNMERGPALAKKNSSSRSRPQAKVKKAENGEAPKKLDTVTFTRIPEPKERAFTFLIPKGWHVEGGIVRVDPLRQGGPAQSIAAKLDLQVKKDAQGSVMEHWLPETAWFDPRHSPAAQMGMMQPGGNYQGMTIMPLMGGQQFLRQVVFKRYHPRASDVKIVMAKNVPKLSQAYQQAAQIVVPPLAPYLRYDAALLHVTYKEDSQRFEETLVTVIENMGSAGAGIWNNKLTFYMRAPYGQYKTWEPVFSVINHSIKIDHRWMAGEVKGQLTRNKIMDKSQKEIQRIAREISEHRYTTNAEIQNDMFLTLMGQEEYVNPYTGEVEIGTDQWRHRWVNESGDIIYSNREEYDPNIDIQINRSDYKRTPIRKRGP